MSETVAGPASRTSSGADVNPKITDLKHGYRQLVYTYRGTDSAGQEYEGIYMVEFYRGFLRQLYARPEGSGGPELLVYDETATWKVTPAEPGVPVDSRGVALKSRVRVRCERTCEGKTRRQSFMLKIDNTAPEVGPDHVVGRIELWMDGAKPGCCGSCDGVTPADESPAGVIREMAVVLVPAPAPKQKGGRRRVAVLPPATPTASTTSTLDATASAELRGGMETLLFYDNPKTCPDDC